jgi:23S rRNA (cytosine1962-C5)-methyltransferase
MMHQGMVRSSTLMLRKDLGRTLRQGHPWVFREALFDPPALPQGEMVAVADKQGRELAFGFWDAKSTIAVRVVDLGPIEDKQALVKRRLRAALELRQARIDMRQTDTFRWVHGEADHLPGIHLDVYRDVATVRFDGEGSRVFYGDLQPLLVEAGASLKLRKLIDREARGEEAEEVGVVENGIGFLVDLGRGQKGGLFLDQRENRKLVGERSAGKSVLNLFGYTGGFSLYAARGDARWTDTVDIARPAIASARRNFEHNGFAVDRAGFHSADVFTFLSEATAKKKTWDIVISDPPSFAPSKNSLAMARRSYLQLHRMAAQVVSPGGTLCAASCSSHLDRREFLTLVKAGVRQAGRRFTLELYTGAGLDHPTLPVFPEGDYLKFALGRVD